MCFLELSCNLLIVFRFRVHLFSDVDNSELRESVAMIVGSFVRVVLSIAVMIACCSALYFALYIEDWNLILFLIIWLFVTIASPTLSSFDHTLNQNYSSRDITKKT
jgi:hypothetical protein